MKNSEGYPDPTAEIAIANVIKAYRPLVYIASPFMGDVEYNISRARGYCHFAISRGCIPIAPHLHFPQFMDDSDRDERELGLLCKCDEVWVFGSRISDGMRKEIAKAKKRGIPVRYFNAKCKEESLDEGTD